MRSILIDDHPDTSATGTGFLTKLDLFGTGPLSFLLRYDAPWRTFSRWTTSPTARATR